MEKSQLYELFGTGDATNIKLAAIILKEMPKEFRDEVVFDMMRGFRDKIVHRDNPSENRLYGRGIFLVHLFNFDVRTSLEYYKLLVVVKGKSVTLTFTALEAKDNEDDVKLELSEVDYYPKNDFGGEVGEDLALYWLESLSEL